MKRLWLILSTCLMILLGILCFSATASAATSGTTGDCTWTLKDGVLTISGKGEMGNYTDTLDRWAYDYNPRPWDTNIQKVIIENGVTTIGRYAFYDCYDLKAIVIPTSVFYVEDGAFLACGIDTVWYTGSKEQKENIYIDGDSLIENNVECTWNYNSCSVGGTHKYTNSCDSSCNRCGAQRSTAHVYQKKAIKKASLLRDGEAKNVCSKCGYTSSQTTTISQIKSVKISKTLYAYDGKTKTPAVTVQDTAGVVLKKGTDYVVTCSSGRKNVGTYKVKVTFKGNYSGSRTLNFTISPTTKTEASIIDGAYGRISAKSNKSIKYVSSNKKVATINSKGEINTKKPGKITIYVQSGTVTQKVVLTVLKNKAKISKTAKTIYVGEGYNLKVTGGLSKTTWKSSNSKVATVNAAGKVVAKKQGKATITAKNGKKTLTCKVTVKWPPETGTVTTKKYSGSDYGNHEFVLKNKAVVSVIGKNPDDSWSSLYLVLRDDNYSDIWSEFIYKESGTFKKTVSLSKGTYKLYIDGDSEDTVTLKITVKPAITGTTKSIERGNTAKLKTVGVKNKGIWSSSNTSVATVSSSGTVTAKNKGTCTIYHKLKDGKKLSYKITVTNPVITGERSFVAKGYSLKLRVSGKQSILKGGKWSSSNTSVATVNSSGVVKGKKAGNCMIYFKLSDGTKLSYAVEVTKPVEAYVTKVEDVAIYNDCYVEVFNFTNKTIDYVEYTITQKNYKGTNLRRPYSYYWYDKGIGSYSYKSICSWVHNDAKYCSVKIKEVKFTDGTKYRP